MIRFSWCWSLFHFMYFTVHVPVDTHNSVTRWPHAYACEWEWEYLSPWTEQPPQFTMCESTKVTRCHSFDFNSLRLTLSCILHTVCIGAMNLFNHLSIIRWCDEERNGLNCMMNARWITEMCPIGVWEWSSSNAKLPKECMNICTLYEVVLVTYLPYIKQ